MKLLYRFPTTKPPIDPIAENIILLLPFAKAYANPITKPTTAPWTAILLLALKKSPILFLISTGIFIILDLSSTISAYSIASELILFIF